MIDKIFEYIINNWPFGAVLLSVAVIVWFASKFHTKLQETHKKVSELPCDQHKEDIISFASKFSKIEETISATNRTIESVNDQLVDINKWIMKTDKDMIDVLVRKRSPLKITSVGEIIFTDSTAKKAVDDNLDFLIHELEKISPNTPYDVEENAVNILLKNRGHNLFNTIKGFLYYAPDPYVVIDPETNEEVKVSLSMQHIIRLMSIYLRDAYLDKHREIQ